MTVFFFGGGGGEGGGEWHIYKADMMTQLPTVPKCPGQSQNYQLCPVCHGSVNCILCILEAPVGSFALTTLTFASMNLGKIEKAEQNRFA